MSRPGRSRACRHSMPSLLATLALTVLLGACASQADLRDIEQFRATHLECNHRHFKRPCQIGPDGKLYEYLPGEQDRP